ncbi:hypothetical protein GUJ93_ZPchr0006g44307 [Zizania palustris]|uniref:Uncharacterized protein n=1 Tax=Zizania palustris TaxID=103762 RepID=A0A8J5T6T2_ZIZPA|nr:hypothetical protein GUJ93_ZPchr0006g44307 [Zizania palustris]
MRVSRRVHHESVRSRDHADAPGAAHFSFSSFHHLLLHDVLADRGGDRPAPGGAGAYHVDQPRRRVRPVVEERRSGRSHTSGQQREREPRMKKPNV